MPRQLTTDEFILRAVRVHKGRYSYSKTIYTSMKTKVEISCVRCRKSFFQTPRDHLIGRGCLKCSGLQRLTTNEFITRSQKIHGTKYDYSKANYVNARTRIEIVCSIHGSFFQISGNHFKGRGCPKCPRIFKRRISLRNSTIVAVNQCDTNESSCMQAIVLF
jgi:hypothetical protein